MYKVPHKFVGMVAAPATQEVIDSLIVFGCETLDVGDVLVVHFYGKVYVSTFYYRSKKEDAELDAARNGFPFYATEQNIAWKVGLRARLYRAIIA